MAYRIIPGYVKIGGSKAGTLQLLWAEHSAPQLGMPSAPLLRSFFTLWALAEFQVLQWAEFLCDAQSTRGMRTGVLVPSIRQTP